MYRTNWRSIADRLVSISQPHVRPIVRGKASASTEFGMKLSISVVDGWSMVEQLSWNNYNEGGDLVRDSERYRERYGSYPASVHADKHRARRKQIREDESIRNAVEGRVGVARRCYSLDRMMTRLADSSQTVVGIVFLVMNLERWLLVPFLRLVKGSVRSYNSSPNIDCWHHAKLLMNTAWLSVDLFSELTSSYAHRTALSTIAVWKTVRRST